MHKDCIIFLNRIENTEVLHAILTQLRQTHFCKLVFILPPNDALWETWIQSNRKEFGFAIDFVTSNNNSDYAIVEALKYTDSDDVLIIYTNTCTTNIQVVDMLAMQQSLQADATITLLNDENSNLFFELNESAIAAIKNPLALKAIAFILFKPSFLSLKFTADFNLVTDYFLQHKLHNHSLVLF
jgi:NDP-sugar pyrophosphorylase family protein